MAQASTLIFVYGTCLPGEQWHGALVDAVTLGAAKTDARYELYDLGTFPAMVEAGTCAVHGELYEVGPALLATLDALEGHPIFLQRTAVVLSDGRTAQAWVLPPGRPTHGARRISTGMWLQRRTPRPPSDTAAPAPKATSKAADASLDAKRKATA